VRYFAPVVDWKKWGLGGSFDFGDPLVLRLWLGPVRIGWMYGHVEDSPPVREGV
jgi:hypothetical protein